MPGEVGGGGGGSGASTPSFMSQSQFQSHPVRVIDTVMGVYPYASDKPHSLSFNRGDTIYVLTKLGSGWWEGALSSGQKGWFPSNYVQRLPVAEGANNSHGQHVSRGSIVSSAGTDRTVDSSDHPSNTPAYSQQPTARHGSTSTSMSNSRLTFMSQGSSSSSELQHVAAPSEKDGASTISATHSMAGNSSLDYMDPLYNKATHEDDATQYSRKNSVSSVASSQNSDFFSRYRSVDTRDTSYSNSASFWMPQISSSGKLLYVNSNRFHVTDELPFERVDAKQDEDIPGSMVIPKELMEGEPTHRKATSHTAVDDIHFVEKTDLSFATKKSWLPSAHEFLGNSVETALISPCDLHDEDFELGWSEALEKLRSSAERLAGFIKSAAIEEFPTAFMNLSLDVQKLSLYIGCPVGAYPSSSQSPDLALCYRKIIIGLARLGVKCSLSVANNGKNASVNEEAEIELIGDLIKNSTNLVTLYQNFLQEGQFYSTESSPATNRIDSPPNEFEVRYFADDTWTTINVSRTSHVLSHATGEGSEPIPGSLALLNRSYRDLTPNKESTKPSLTLIVYDASNPLDYEVQQSLEARLRTIDTICTQLSKLCATAPATTEIEATQDRSKMLLSSLQTYTNIVKSVANSYESVDTSRFYSSRPPPADSSSGLATLDKYLQLKEQIYSIITALDNHYLEVESGTDDFLLSMSDSLDQLKIGDSFFAYEQRNEVKIKKAALEVRDCVKKLLEQVKVLVHAAKYFGPVDSRLYAINADAFDFGSGLSCTDSRRSSLSLRRQESSVADVTSLSDSQIWSREDDVPWYLRLEHADETIYDKKGNLRGGTVRALVEQLTLHNKLNSEFNVAMLLTFQSFMDAKTLFKLLVERFMIQPPEGLTPDEFTAWTDKKQRPIRLRVVNILKTWLDLYWFEDDNDEMSLAERQTLFENMLQFSAQLKAQKVPGGASFFNVVEKRMNVKEKSFKRHVVTTTTRPPAPILPANLKRFKLSEIDAMEMARQLCLREFKLLVQITSQECLRRGHGRFKKSNSHIGQFIHNSNCMTNWVAYAILRHTDPKRRANCVRYFIKVAEYCRSLNNFSSMTAIISALYSSTIHRMRKTWALVSSKNVQKLENMNKLMNSSRNFNEYRDILSLVSSPTIPFFGVYLTDLTFVEDGNPDYLDSAQQYVNFAKRIKASSIIENIRQFQIMAYNFEEVPDIQQFLSQGFEQASSIEEQYETSLKYEPRERPGDQQQQQQQPTDGGKEQKASDKVAKLLQANGLL